MFAARHPLHPESRSRPPTGDVGASGTLDAIR
jgi:hypothetical protein